MATTNVKDIMSKYGFATGAESYRPNTNSKVKFGNESFLRLGHSYRREAVKMKAEAAQFHIDSIRIATTAKAEAAVNEIVEKAKSFAKSVWEAIVNLCKKIAEKVQGALDSIFDNETKFRKGIDGIAKVLATNPKEVEADKVKDKKFKLRSFAGGPSDLDSIVTDMKTQVDAAYSDQEDSAFSKATSAEGIEAFLTALYPDWKKDTFKESDLKATLESKKNARKGAKEGRKDFKESLKESEYGWEEAHKLAESYLKVYQGAKSKLGDGSLTKKLGSLLKNMKQMQKAAEAIVKAGKITISGDKEDAALATKAGNFVRAHLANGIMKSTFELGNVKATFGVLLAHMKQCGGVYLASNYKIK